MCPFGVGDGGRLVGDLALKIWDIWGKTGRKFWTKFEFFGTNKKFHAKGVKTSYFFALNY
jgi:hypothetical protein